MDQPSDLFSLPPTLNVLGREPTVAMTSMEMQHLCHQLGLKPKNQDEKKTNDLKREH